MQFKLNQAVEILERTPAVLRNMLSSLSDDWLNNNEGGDSWNPFYIVGHLVHGEKTDWITRSKIILAQGDNITFEPFDRFAQFEDCKGKTINQLLDEFSKLRTENLEVINNLNISVNQLDLKGMHPALGEVTLRQLLATWVTHDLGHIAQISRVMAKQYKTQVGPWLEYISVLNR